MLAVTCVALRVYTRACIVGKMGAEDWTMVAAGVRGNCALHISVLTTTVSHHGLLVVAYCRIKGVQNRVQRDELDGSANGGYHQGQCVTTITLWYKADLSR